MITIVAKCSVKPESAEQFVELARELVKASRSEEGNVSYEFFSDISFAGKFTFIECWKDQSAIDIHNASQHFIGFGKKASPLFTAPLDVALYQKLI